MNNQSEQAGPSDHLDANVYACFTPNPDCIETILSWIDIAQERILVQAYRFSNKKIANALINSKKKGVNVEIFIDKTAKKEKGNLIKELESNEIKVLVDYHNGLAHNKVMIIDSDYVITGSYNWTDDEYNKYSDSILFIRNKCVNEKFEINYESNKGEGNNKTDLQLLFRNPIIDVNCCLGALTTKSRNKKFKIDNAAEVNVCFPGYYNQNCINVIVEHMMKAEKLIYVQACSLTHEEISNELIKAHQRKIDIKLLVDKSIHSYKEEKVTDLVKKGIKVRYDTMYCDTIAHSKNIIIDDDLVLAGSFNLTKKAQNRNFENLVQVRNFYVNDVFKKEFESLWDHGSDIPHSHCKIQ